MKPVNGQAHTASKIFSTNAIFCEIIELYGKSPSSVVRYVVEVGLYEVLYSDSGEDVSDICSFAMIRSVVGNNRDCVRIGSTRGTI